ncbi:MAG TPA: carbohydrate ABC transporter permease [Noviherbaspirillum sp.]|uniref:carbohydrate ABC transporter permease n=1 Tax=Noviherbaspirillum sp. TaxID=1926288 RepID=UPI002B46876D|nr:carbohydrate ABC transporter permease [Noviherbaspirillum sp.]HJV88192.1 carbohydrate ABC transporter permease [Noviherbaspirillum sp.]
MTVRYQSRLFGATQNALILFIAAAILIPIYWMVAAGFKSYAEVFEAGWTFTPTLENFRAIMNPPYEIHKKFFNSTVVAIVTIAIAIPVATLSAYSFSRFRLRYEKSIFMAIIATQFVPSIILVLPFFILFRDTGLLDTWAALILVNLSFVTPYAVWMIKGFIDAIPLDTEEAALVDGSTRLQVIKNVVIPMAAPGLITASIFCFIICWNEFLLALIVTSKDAVTLPVGLAMFTAEEGDLWQLISATGVLIMLPMFALGMIIQKHFIQGSTSGAVR